MSKPTPEQLAANIDPLTREYIDAHIRNLTTQLNNTTEALNAALSRTLVTARALESDAARSVRTLIARLMATNTPLVTSSTPFPGFDIPSADTDNVGGSRAITARLVATGRSKLVAIAKELNL